MDAVSVGFLGVAAGAVGAGGFPDEAGLIGELDDFGEASVEPQFERCPISAGVVGPAYGAGPAQPRGLLRDTPGGTELGVACSGPASGARRTVSESPGDALDLVKGIQMGKLPVRREHGVVGDFLSVVAVGGFPCGDRPGHLLGGFRYRVLQAKNLVVDGRPYGRSRKVIMSRQRSFGRDSIATGVLA